MRTATALLFGVIALSATPAQGQTADEDYARFAQAQEALKRQPRPEQVDQAQILAGQFLDRHRAKATPDQLTLAASTWIQIALMRNQHTLVRDRIRSLRELPSLPAKLDELCAKTTALLDRREALAAGKANAQAGKPAPAWSASDVRDGTQLELAGLKGKVVLLHFWATWCRPCEDLMAEELTPLLRRYADTAFSLVGVGQPSNGDTPAKQKEFLGRTGHAWRHVFDPTGTIASSYGAEGLPFLCLVDGDGKILVIGPAYGVLAEVKRVLGDRLGPGEDAKASAPAGPPAPPR